MTEQNITLPVELLAGADVDPRWNDGPFLAIKLMPAKAKGKRFEQIAQEVLKSRGHTVGKPLNSDHDRIVDGAKYEIKGSTITKGSDNVFSFLQVRPAQDYEFLILETFWFDGTIQYHRIPKEDLKVMIENRVFAKQHGGNKAESGTFCYNGDLTPFNEYFWFSVKVS